MEGMGMQVEDVCVYCGMNGVEDPNPVPRADEDEEWERMAQEHYEDCEWIATRAHQRGMEA